MRKAAVYAGVGILCLTAWVCLVAAGIVLMRPALGTGVALLVMAGVLVTAAVFVVVIGRLLAPSLESRHARDQAQDATLAAVVTRAIVSGLNDKKKLGLTLAAASVMSAAVAFLLFGQDADGKD